MSPLPNLIIAGVNKAATTSLRQYLIDHPDVCGADVKEVFFWNRNDNIHHPDLEAYRTHYKTCGPARVVIDNTPRYFHDIAADAALLRQHLGPDLRVIVVLRDPVSRLFSFYKFKKRSLELDATEQFSTYVRKCLSLPEAERKNGRMLYNGAEEGKYSQALEQWYNAFGDRLHVIFFDALNKNPRTVLNNIASWLGIETGFYNTYDFTRENQSIAYKNKQLHRLGIKMFRRFERFFMKNKNIRQWLTRFYYRLNGQPFESHVDEATRQQLEEFYSASLLDLKQLLERMQVGNLPGWITKAQEK